LFKALSKALAVAKAPDSSKAEDAISDQINQNCRANMEHVPADQKKDQAAESHLGSCCLDKAL
jgi:hypothetical protein